MTMSIFEGCSTCGGGLEASQTGSIASVAAIHLPSRAATGAVVPVEMSVYCFSDDGSGCADASATITRDDGVVISQQTLQIPAHESRVVGGGTVFSEPGEYTITFDTDDHSEEATITVTEPARIGAMFLGAAVGAGGYLAYKRVRGR